MKKICIVTSTRAEYGLLKPLMVSLSKMKKIEVNIVVTGTHLSHEFGYTISEIESDGIPIDEKIEIIMGSDTPVSVSKSMGLALISFGEYFNRKKPDLLIVLGDRYEILAVCSAAVNFNIPIAHLHGGEITEGAIDEVIRHSISKMSYLHFTSSDVYRKRVIQLGEDPSRVFNVGALGVENILKTPLLNKYELEQSINFLLDKPYALVTFHPVTKENNTAFEQTEQLLNAIDSFKDIKFIFTKANADADGRVINKLIDNYVEKNRENSIAFTSLGQIRYLSAMKYSAFVMGNSSSGIIETPTFKIPCINIGDRQKGRIQATNIINCPPKKADIILAIKHALSPNFRLSLSNLNSPFGNGDTSEHILRIILQFLQCKNQNFKKKFYDISFEG
ncbi:UDP-N-acetylglucosamine 2-epimerase [Neobacillus endophyticus]|uniref:UDP-N-acetylglucosamine 2-epimerase n=1 Tax=Neobacillus endophyticus TaxID=2738405 RepID=UPI0028A844AD|nr:UDP-N-acetylglucosamine 2-epimerase [Neobacillus endophyticus]